MITLTPPIDPLKNKHPDSLKRKRRLTHLWRTLVGEPGTLTIANRAFNAISIFTLIILVILLPINLAMGLYPVAAVVLVLIVLQSVFYYLSRIRKMYRLSMICYAVVSYATLILNFFFNSGSSGPTIFLFFLTYELLIAFTPKRQQLGWTLVHILLPPALLLIEYYHPRLVPDSYHNPGDRIFDLSTSYVVIIICMFFVTIYLRKSYAREKKNAEERANKIEQQNKMLDHLNKEKIKLLSIISHDLRSPLNSITSVLELLNDPELGMEERMEFKRELLHTTRSTSDMLVNLLSWSSGQIKGVRPHLVPVNVATVLERVLEVQRLLAAKKSIGLTVMTCSEQKAMADANMLELVLRNLVNNAIKFTSEGGSILINAFADEDTCIISVKDSGTGLTQEQQHRLFSLNVQSSYGTGNEPGIGLGLLLCKEFTLAQKGKIWAQNNEDGNGCTFFLSLPLPVDVDQQTS